MIKLYEIVSIGFLILAIGLFVAAAFALINDWHPVVIIGSMLMSLLSYIFAIEAGWRSKG